MKKEQRVKEDCEVRMEKQALVVRKEELVLREKLEQQA